MRARGGQSRSLKSSFASSSSSPSNTDTRQFLLLVHHQWSTCLFRCCPPLRNVAQHQPLLWPIVQGLFLLGLVWLLYYVWYLIWGEGPPPPPALYQQLYREVAMVLDEAREQFGGEWWITEGSLLAALRYGRMEGQLEDGKIQKVDHDLDIMYGTTSALEWEHVREFILVRLQEEGWRWCWRKKTAPSFSQRMDKMSCEHGGSLITMSDSHLDLHNYVRPKDTDPRIAPKHADVKVWSHRRFSKEFERLQATSSDGKDVIVSQNKWEYGGYPFEDFSDGRMPLSMLFPLQKCKMFSLELPCPAKPVEVLERWHGREYSGTCLAYPLNATEGDKEMVRQHTKKLHDKGYPSFYEATKKESCL